MLRSGENRADHATIARAYVLPMLTTVPIWVIALLFASIVIFGGECGFHIGKRAKTTLGESPFAVLQAAIFGLLGLLLAFSFSLGLARYDARRAEVINEANAIASAQLRSELLTPPAAAAVRTALKRYVDARIDFARQTVDERARAAAAGQSAALQRQIWNVAKGEFHRDPHSVAVYAFVQALSTMIDESGQEEAILSAHVPDEVIVTLAVVIAFASILLGVGFGRTDRRGVLGIILFAVVIGLVVATIVDLDRPQRGFIRVSLRPLQELRTGNPP